MTASSSAGASESKPFEHLPLVLGVDGGGTKTLAWVAQVDDQGFAHVLGQAFSGSSNQVAVGVEPALDNLANAIEKACEHANISSNDIAAGVLAMAGSGNAEARQTILDFVFQRFQISKVQVIHDGQAVLKAGTPEGWGIALIAGTGAVAYGKNQQGETVVVGGWGYWFGDEGSAYWLGQAALRAISQAADGRAAPTALSDVVLNRLEIQDPRQILATLSQQGDTRLAIADLAELVCEVAAQKDDVASSILNEATEQWVQHIECLANQLSINEPLPIALAGGVLCGSKFARERLREKLTAREMSPYSVELVHEPVYGCVLMAWHDLKSISER